MDDLLIIEEKIDLEVRSLETCMYDHKTFSEILNRVQKAVDDLNLHSYSNLPIWVNKLDMEVGLRSRSSIYLEVTFYSGAKYILIIVFIVTQGDFSL